MVELSKKESESEFQKRVVKMIKKEFPDMWFYKASDRFITGIPDLVGCCKGCCVGRAYEVNYGQMWGIELKVGKNKPTELQEYTMEQMRQAGAKVIWSRDIDEIREFLKAVEMYG